MPIKSTTTTEGEKRAKKKFFFQKNLQNKSKHKNNKCFSWVTAVRVLFPCWELQSTSHPLGALQHCADLWTCCGDCSNSNLVLRLCVLAFNVHSYQNWCVFFCGSSQYPYIFHRQSLPSWSCGFNLQLLQLVGRFWVFFLSHIAPGFQLWFYFHLCMWVVHWGLLLRLPWRTWVCPCEGQVWRWCSCLDCRGSGCTRYSGELSARAARNIVF